MSVLHSSCLFCFPLSTKQFLGFTLSLSVLFVISVLIQWLLCLTDFSSGLLHYFYPVIAAVYSSLVLRFSLPLSDWLTLSDWCCLLSLSSASLFHVSYMTLWERVCTNYHIPTKTIQGTFYYLFFFCLRHIQYIQGIFVLPVFLYYLLIWLYSLLMWLYSLLCVYIL